MALVVSICAGCGGAFAATLLDICYACGLSAGAVAARAEHERRSDASGSACPALTARDFAALERLVRSSPDARIAGALLRKLAGTRVLSGNVPTLRRAALGSRIVFAAEDGCPEARVLVLPMRHSTAGWTLPVTAPRGLALLGHMAGATVAVDRHDGTAERLRLLAVAHEPGAAAHAAEVLPGVVGAGAIWRGAHGAAPAAADRGGPD